MTSAPRAPSASPGHTIIVGDGLEEEIISPQVRHLDSRNHVGAREVERLFGRGRGFGQGPLPAFLRAALDHRESGKPVGVILLAHVGAASEEDLSETRFGAPIDAVAARARVIPCPGGRVP